MSKPSFKYIALLASVFLAAGLQGCAQEKKAVASPPIVLVRPAEPGLMGGMRATGMIESLGHHVLASEVSGRMVRVNALVGDRVSKGQILAILDPQPTALQLSQARAGLKQAEIDLGLKQSNLNRLKGLVEAGTLSAAELERAQAELQAARQTLLSSRARTDLALRASSETLVRAPVSGIVSVRAVQPSQIVAAGTPLFELEAGSQRIIRTFVPTPAVSTLKAGQTLSFEFGGRVSQARLIGLNGKASATGAVEATLSVGADAPLPGTPVTVLFDDGVLSGVRVPATSVTFGADGMHQVWTINQRNQIEPVRVKLVQLNQTSALVSGAIAPGTPIVSAGTDWVKAGEKVSPKLMTR
jgi:RND family efflux transporter MFP subunit